MPIRPGWIPPPCLPRSSPAADSTSVPAPQRGWDALDTIAKVDADALIELSYTDLKTGEPAITHLRAALERGLHVVTTNKGPIALRYPELKAIADRHGVEIGAEGTVMSGTPSLRFGQELLAAAGITRIQGIVNGTTNYILTQMENGMDYAAALAGAQAKGYAEADPTGDVEGFDAAGKVVILANLLMGASLDMAAVDRTGITALTPQDIASAQAAGERWKLIGRVESEAGKVDRVGPPHPPAPRPPAGLSRRRDQRPHLYHRSPRRCHRRWPRRRAAGNRLRPHL